MKITHQILMLSGIILSLLTLPLSANTPMPKPTPAKSASKPMPKPTPAKSAGKAMPKPAPAMSTGKTMPKHKSTRAANKLPGQSVAGSGEMKPGHAKIFQMKGEVKIMNLDTGESFRPKRGQKIQQNSVVETGLDSRVLLLFSNGATVNVQAQSSMSILRFLQAPWNKRQHGQYLMLKEEPSATDTLLSLNFGEVLGKVKKLHPDSLYDVETPIGGAGVRGTTFLVAFFIDEAEGNYVMKIGNIQGQVAVTTTMPSNIQVSESGIAETEFDPTNTLSTGDIPEKSIVIVTASPDDVPDLGYSMPQNIIPTNVEEELEKLAEAIKAVLDPDNNVTELEASGFRILL